MDTCFLFTEFLNEEGCLFLKLGTDETIKQAPTQLSFNEISELQKESRTILVDSTSHATLIHLELPWLSEGKARTAIPYALEDKVAQPVEELHFAFDKAHYVHNRYLIAVIAKERLHYLMQHMLNHSIKFNMITIDWYALEDNQLCISDSNLLVNTASFKGALSNQLALSYLKQHPEQCPLVFKNNTLALTGEVIAQDELSYTWIAKKLLTSAPLNLCQGEMQQGSGSNRLMKGYTLAAILGCFWLLSIVVVDGLTLYSLNKKTAKIDSQIEAIYRQFFPQARQVISPKFRISKLLENNQDKSQERFWYLLNEFATHIKGSPINTEQLRYLNNMLLVTVVSPDFVHLETLEKNLRNAQLKVKQTQASTQEQQVIATLELS